MGKLEFKVHLPQLLQEISNNEGMAAVSMPIKILQGILTELAHCAIRVNDPQLHSIMCKLALYAVADPYDKQDFDADITAQIIAEGDAIRDKKK